MYEESKKTDSDAEFERLDQELAESGSVADHGALVLGYHGENAWTNLFIILILAAFAAVFVSAIPTWGRVIAPLIGAILIFITLRLQPGDIQLYERAVRIRRPLSDTILKLDDITGFSYDASRTLIPHADGTKSERIYVKMVFLTTGGSERVFSTDVEGKKMVHSRLHPIPQKIIPLLSDRMLAEVKSSGASQWTPSLKLTAEGASYLDETTRQWKDLRLQSFQHQVDWTINEEGQFVLLEKSSGKPLHNEDLSSMNFYPGLHLMLKRFGDSNSQDLAIGFTLTLRQKERIF